MSYLLHRCYEYHASLRPPVEFVICKPTACWCEQLYIPEKKTFRASVIFLSLDSFCPMPTAMIYWQVINNQHFVKHQIDS